MARLGLTPTAVTVCAMAGIALFLFARGVSGPANDLPGIVGEASCVAAYVIGLDSCRRVAALYPKTSPVGLGWLALGGNCFLSIFRHLALNPLLGKAIGPRERVYFISQSIQLLALICVLAGTLAIWWGVYRLLVGFRLRWEDFRGIAVIAALVVWASSSHISLSHSGQGGIAFLQVFGLGLLIAIGAVGLLLHSLSMQMGGGRLAMVMQWIAAYALTRSALTLWQGWGGNESLAWWLAFYSVPWIFALGAAYSCWLADTVKRGIRRQPYGDWDVSSLAE